MKVTQLELAGLKLIEPLVHEDARGLFVETWSGVHYRAAGIDCEFVQDNHACSMRGTIRGLHYQSAPGQAKLIRVALGEVYDVAVDIRHGSPTFGRWYGVHLDGTRHHQLFVPVGFAHGYCVLSDVAHVLYKVSAPYDASTERGLAWNDPDIAIDWPVRDPRLSDRDRTAPSLAAYRGGRRS